MASIFGPSKEMLIFIWKLLICGLKDNTFHFTHLNYSNQMNPSEELQ